MQGEKKKNKTSCDFVLLFQNGSVQCCYLLVAYNSGFCFTFLAQKVKRSWLWDQSSTAGQ